MAQGNRYRPYDAPYESDYPSYDDRYAEPVDLDSLGSQVRSTHSSRSVATREEFLPEDSVPLFLSGADEELRSSKFARPRKGILFCSCSFPNQSLVMGLAQINQSGNDAKSMQGIVSFIKHSVIKFQI